MNKVLFIQGGSRLKRDKEGNWYTDANFNNEVWKRYHSYFEGELHVILRSENKVYSVTEAKKFNPVDQSIVILHPVPDLMYSISNFVDLKLRRKISNTIRRLIHECDHIIIRSAMTYYSCEAAKIANELHKPYLVEVTGFALDSLWYHDIFGKVIALPVEIREKNTLIKAPYAVYVTQKALQQRYPTLGENIGCSDVDLEPLSQEIIKKRAKCFLKDDTLVIGTAAFTGVKWKGQATVIKAIKRLKDKGITNIRYELIGSGDHSYLRRIAKSCGVEDQVVFLGPKEHKDVFTWLEHIDIYIQPSYQEGLCRSIVEAMSKGCPVLATSVGGNEELIENSCLFKKGDSVALAKLLKCAFSKKWLVSQSEINYLNAQSFDREILDLMREQFYKKFLSEEHK